MVSPPGDFRHILDPPDEWENDCSHPSGVTLLGVGWGALPYGSRGPISDIQLTLWSVIVTLKVTLYVTP